MTNHTNETTTTDLHTHASEVDTRIAATYVAFVQAQGAEASARVTIRQVAGQRRNYDRAQSWSGTFTDALDAVLARSQVTPTDYHTGRAAAAITALADAEEATAEAKATYNEAEGEYAGWSRFFLVTGGHIHATMNCTTCYDTTEFNWLPTLSGLTEADAVAVYGSVLCTVCYPSAPVDMVGGKSDGLTLAERAEAQAAKDEAKAAKAAAKAAKSLNEPVRVSHGSRTETVTTIAAARRLLKEGIDNRAYGYHTFDTPEQHESEAILVAALEAKGVDIATAIAKWTKAAGK